MDHVELHRAEDLSHTSPIRRRVHQSKMYASYMTTKNFDPIIASNWLSYLQIPPKCGRNFESAAKINIS